MNMTNLQQALKRFLSLSLAVVAIATTIFLSFPAHTAAMNEAGQVVKERAKSELDSKTSAGVGNELEGKVKKNVGKVQRQFGDSTEGMAQQLEGQAQETAGKAQRKAEELAEDAQEKAGGIVESIQDFFD